MSRSLGPEFDYFLRRVLPGLGLDWRRHRRRSVRRRLSERLRQTSLRSLDEYETRLSHDPDERKRFYRLLGVTISRFFRNAHIFDFLESRIWPQWRNRRCVTMLSAGCACGEEPYSLAISWRELGPPEPKVRIPALDMDFRTLKRARTGRYPAGSLREAPSAFVEKYFSPHDRDVVISDTIKKMVRFYLADLREIGPPQGLDLVMCRNLAYTYFTFEVRDKITLDFAQALNPAGFLVVGSKERPNTLNRFKLVHPCVYQKMEI